MLAGRLGTGIWPLWRRSSEPEAASERVRYCRWPSGRRCYNHLHPAPRWAATESTRFRGSRWILRRLPIGWRGCCAETDTTLETSLRSGTFLIDWFLDNCTGVTSRHEVRGRLESEAASLPVGSGGVSAVPYCDAVMTPYWDPDARGCLVRLTGAHHTAHLYRALLEGIALEQAMVKTMIE
jgi:glycerol kinase